MVGKHWTQPEHADHRLAVGFLTAASPEPSASSERELTRWTSSGWLRPEPDRLRFWFWLDHYLFCDVDTSHSLLELRARSMPPKR